LILFNQVLLFQIFLNLLPIHKDLKEVISWLMVLLHALYPQESTGAG
jgi:hypothetical protein